jgi:hypothetical protein
MRSAAILPAALAVGSSVWAMIAAYRMGAWLSHHGVKVNWFWYRVTMPWHISRYRQMTTEIDGKAGPLYVQFIVAINLALLFAVVMFVAVAVATG